MSSAYLRLFRHLPPIHTPLSSLKSLNISVYRLNNKGDKIQPCLYKLFESKQISTNLKLRMINCYIYSILLYGCETWTLSKGLSDKLEACEMFFLRRMGKISWKQKTSNDQVLEKFNTRRQLLEIIKNRIMSFFGHIKRHNSIIKDILEGKVEGKRGRGRPRAAWPDNIRTWADCSLAESTRRARDRVLWRFTARQPLRRKDGTSN